MSLVLVAGWFENVEDSNRDKCNMRSLSGETKEEWVKQVNGQDVKAKEAAVVPCPSFCIDLVGLAFYLKCLVNLSPNTTTHLASSDMTVCLFWPFFTSVGMTVIAGVFLILTLLSPAH